MSLSIEQLETILLSVRPNVFEPIKDLAERVAMSRPTTGSALAECRRRGFISTQESANRGYFQHTVQNKGHAFLEWMKDGRNKGYVL